jgi:DNA helicase-2/ATP-dependent DNA helicase PcrA
MAWLADLHIHSHYSRATGRQLNLPQVDLWGRYKGLTLLGTGDCTHPGWLEEIGAQLEPAEEGFYLLKPEWRLSVPARSPRLRSQPPVRFVVTGEISSIYKKHGVTRKVHTLVVLPSLEAGRSLSQRLGRLGNVISDGRPILGLDAKHLLELILEIDAAALVIPAHIWTPWFSVLGSKSGFASLEECYEELVEHLAAVETGLSSDPPMNWRLRGLDRFTLVSNSDAHSPQKIGREANILSCPLSYPALGQALRTGAGFEGTIEFFPHEGKYHLDGHRKCGQRLQPEESKRLQGLCPTCGRPLTLGVLHRVLDLADRAEGEKPVAAKPYEHLIPLPEILGEVLQCGPETKRAQELYFRLLDQLGPEMAILREVPPDQLAREGGPVLAAAIDKMRRGEVHIQGGYDGEFGTIRLFTEAERQELARQPRFWLIDPATAVPGPGTVGPEPTPAKHHVAEASSPGRVAWHPKEAAGSLPDYLQELNPEQRAAVLHTAGPVLIQAGPGTGKTRTLTHRVAHLVQQGAVPPEQILAVTFTRQAAQEMRARLQQLLAGEAGATIHIKTFHALGLEILQSWGASDRQVSSDELLQPLLAELAGQCGLDGRTLAALISRHKQDLLYPPDLADDLPWRGAYQAYEVTLAQQGWYDFDDLVAQAVRLLQARPDLLASWQQRFSAILVDEYQDVNRAQYELLRRLAPPDYTNLCVIGDPHQAIYGFRGARPEFFGRFCQDWPLANRVSLSETYRLPAPLLQLAQQVLGVADGAVPSRTCNPTALPPVLLEAVDAQGEAHQIARLIDYLVGGGSHLALEDQRLRYTEGAPPASFRDIAVLFRFHALGETLQKYLHEAGIPCQLARDSTSPELMGVDLLAEKVTLLTLHAAKGLEFPYVFIIGCEAGLLPYEPSDNSRVDPAEERRLLYVGLTRASRQLFLSTVRQRFLWGERGSGRLPTWLEAQKVNLAASPLANPSSRRSRPRQRSLF